MEKQSHISLTIEDIVTDTAQSTDDTPTGVANGVNADARGLYQDLGAIHTSKRSTRSYKLGLIAARLSSRTRRRR